ncbi:NitT/TauT family transport system substrate-binding protein [Kineothrix alysoides]|uniref:NitT/TauT family transport system substrate-binding protein n=1 Tax=Kineothrix alysoides TaxID=1469948 RepID=A0A4R1QYE3_9FIRM|nr:ABC transporter substrate-binding protein [Kineothrix alysoides]TCL57290.1 NitT/TauT family transport system substrate-binding protein [Kineothrix alysoides]
MKKLLMLPISLVLCLTLITGCGSQAGSSAQSQSEETLGAESQASGEEVQVEDSSKAQEEPAPEEIADATDTADTTVRVMALKGPTAMGLVELMNESETGVVNGNDYEFTIAASADEVTPKLVQGETDIAAVPANLASVLYNNTDGQIRVLAINTLGVIYIVDTGDTVHSAADLKGKTIYASGKGATPEYALNYILIKNGIDPEKDVTIEWKSEHAECVAALAASEDEGIALLPQPFVTTAQIKNDRIRIALDLTQEWDKLQKDEETPSALLTGVIVARADFIEEHPEAVSAFMDSYKKSVDYVNGNVEEAAKLIEKFDIVPAAVAQKALPYCNITFIEGAEMKDKLSGYLSVLLEQNEKSVGGEIPADDFYYERQGK